MKSADLTFQNSSKSSELDLDFKEYWNAVKRRWLPATTASLITLSLAGLAILQQKPVYETKGKILIKPDETPSLTGLESGQEDLEPLTLQSNPLKTEIEIILSRPIIEKTISEANVVDESGEPKSVSSVRGSLNVEVANGTDILEISYSGLQPEQSASIVNTLMNLYIENNIRLNQAEAIAAREFLSRELPTAEAAVQRAELELSRFKEANQLVAIDAESQEAVELVATLDQQLAETRALLDNTNAQLSSVQERLNMGLQLATQISAVSQSEGVRELLTELQTVESQLTSERTFFQDGSPQIVDLEKRRGALQDLLSERIRRVIGNNQAIPDRNLQLGELEQGLIDSFVNLEIQRLGLSNQVRSLQESRSDYINRISNLPRLEREQRSLQRRLNVVQTNYENLLARQQEVQAVENQTLGNARIIEVATIPEDPALNTKAFALGMGGLLASFMVFGLVTFACEIQDPKLKSVGQVKKLLKYRLIEVIPSAQSTHAARLSYPLKGLSNKSLSNTPFINAPNSPISEVYRMLQVNLQSYSLKEPCRKIVVSSAIPNEGKSTVAANLALATAELGEKVLLIDANLRRPSLHRTWNTSGSVGLCNVLSEEIQLESAVQSIAPNFDILTAGSSVEFPLALLKSSKMSKLLRTVSQKYSWIIIDTPPLLLAPDALGLNELSDGMVLVARLGELDSSSAVAARETLERSNQKVLGMVVNDASNDSEYVNRLDFIEGYYSNRNNQHSVPASSTAMN